MTYTGRCSCGGVTLKIEAEPVATRQCWCRQCQKIAAGGPTNNAIFSTDAITMTGEAARSSYVAASGNTLTHEFCPGCGTHVYAYSSARPHLRTVRIGPLDEGHGLKPIAAIWLDDAPDWAFIDPGLERWQQQPPASASAAKS
jgi:hypothetical protein